MSFSKLFATACIGPMLVLTFALLTPSVSCGFQQDATTAPAEDKQIQFTAFYKVDWRSIIEYYADQAGLSLQFVDQPPTGTFDYQSDRSMSLQEGLDFLNQMLIQNDRVLIRNEDLLLLYDVTRGIPDDMIQTVSADDLEKRGKYEVLNCNFDITGLQGEELRGQLQPFVSDHYQRKMMVVQAAELVDADLKPTGRRIPDIKRRTRIGPNQHYGFWVKGEGE